MTVTKSRSPSFLRHPFAIRRRIVPGCGALLALCVAAPTAADVPVSVEILDAEPPEDPWMKATGDIDGDGMPDIVVGGRTGPVVWYRAPDWSRHSVADDVSPNNSSTDADLFDVDGDGDRDVVLANGVWHENPRPGGDPAAGSWPLRGYGTRDGHDVQAADLDGDGDLDLVTRDQGTSGDTVWIYRNDGPDAWLEIAVAPLPDGEGIALGDLDADGDPDLAIADRWYENDGSLASGGSGGWEERRFDPAASPDPDTVVAIVDLDQDGRADVVTTPAEAAGGSGTLAWFRAPPDPRRDDWTRFALSGPVSTTHHSLVILDWDLDGDPDIATARMHQAQDPAVEVRLNDGTTTLWPVEVVDDRSSHNLQAADLDLDGDVDLVGADWDTGASPDGAPLRLWRGEPLPEPGALSGLFAGAALLGALHTRRPRGARGSS